MTIEVYTTEEHHLKVGRSSIGIETLPDTIEYGWGLPNPARIEDAYFYPTILGLSPEKISLSQSREHIHRFINTIVCLRFPEGYRGTIFIGEPDHSTDVFVIQSEQYGGYMFARHLHPAESIVFTGQIPVVVVGAIPEIMKRQLWKRYLAHLAARKTGTVVKGTCTTPQTLMLEAVNAVK